MVRSDAWFLTRLESTLEEKLDLVNVGVSPGGFSFLPNVLADESQTQVHHGSAKLFSAFAQKSYRKRFTVQLPSAR
jgi:hypothetical protein